MQLSKKKSKVLTDLIQPLVEDLGFELIELRARQEHQRNILEVFLDKENGITLDDCALVSEKLSMVLDVEDFFQHKYYLEVSSPGIFRELKSERDFLRSLNSRVKAVFHSPIKGQKTFVGVLRQYQNETITLDNDTHEFLVKLDEIKKIHLFPDV